MTSQKPIFVGGPVRIKLNHNGLSCIKNKIKSRDSKRLERMNALIIALL